MGMIPLTTAKFKEDIFDYTQSQEWSYQGDMPCIIDFYADWCGPCKAVAPILDELANEYEGKVRIYRVDTEVEQELSAVFGVRSIPSILFVPTDKQPMMQNGALPKHALQNIIQKELLNEVNEI